MLSKMRCVLLKNAQIRQMRRFGPIRPFRDSWCLASAEYQPTKPPNNTFPVPSTKGWTTRVSAFTGRRGKGYSAERVTVPGLYGIPTRRARRGLFFALGETRPSPGQPNLLALPVRTLQAMPL
ncbi:hypothetical protein PHPALM_28125 [Phytophthora palmivora]|uniref:Uncharacterized protein n=1 Tax=Phytophthora palmivora TaxID=4796 RepID=A0A2P4XAV0_9STRA|nr:hypothetical protein PHPALM_28125 [Phytophthora palmivora]